MRIWSATRSRPVDELGHGVLDLDPRVQLEEEVLPSRDHELRGAGSAVADRGREADGCGPECDSQLVVDRCRRRLLEHLLVAALDRALTLPERDGSSGVREELHFDVPRLFEVALAEDRSVAEGRAASLRAVASAFSRSTGERTIRIPRPPPPAAAFTSSG